MLYFIRALRQIRFLLRQRKNNGYKKLENFNDDIGRVTNVRHSHVVK